MKTNEPAAGRATGSPAPGPSRRTGSPRAGRGVVGTAVLAATVLLMAANGLTMPAPKAAVQPAARTYRQAAARAIGQTGPEAGGQTAAEAGEQTTASRRIISIGDVHGALDEFTAILREVGLVDESLDWAGGDTIMVQTGDFTDRGPGVRPAMDLLMKLQKQAPEQDGAVIVTLGNHEAMNLIGFLRDNSPADAAGFADDASPRLQQDAWEQWTELRRLRAASMEKPEPLFTPDVRRLWEESHPPGYVERTDAFAPDGEYGRWLRQLPTAVRIGNVLFMHAGISPEYADLDLDEINERISSEIGKFDHGKQTMVDAGLITRYADLVEIITAADEKLGEMLQALDETGQRPDTEGQQLAHVLDWMIQYQSWQLLTRDGLLWFRGLAQWPEEEHAADIAKILAAQGVDHIVVGHTVQLDGNARARFGGAVFLTDTGMLEEVYGGRPSALEIKDGTFTAIYLGERKQLYPVTEGAPAADPAATTGRAWLGMGGDRLPFDGDEALLGFLRTADVVSSEELGSGKTEPRLVELELDGVRARAIFHDVDVRRERVRVADRFYAVFRDTWRSQVAAYRLARLLGFDNVAPTVARTLGGQPGSLQLWLENEGIRTDSDRVAALDHPPDVTSWLHQQWGMYVFDALVFNEDRNGGNVLVDDRWKLWMIDHTRAFQTDPSIGDTGKLVRIERTLMQRLRELDRETLSSSVGAYLEDDQISAVLQRRDAIVEHFERLIEEQGEESVLYDADPGAGGGVPSADFALTAATRTQAL